MTIQKKDIEHIAYLARIRLSDEELALLTPQIETILAYVEKLQQLDVEQVEPTSHVLPLQNIMRQDTARPSLAVDEALQNAPDTGDGFFKVPRIINQS